MTTDPENPSPARVYDYLLGGTNNFEADRRVADGVQAVFPELVDWAWTNRGFHQRATLWLAQDVGIRQFLDIGSGLPTRTNTHDVVRRASADAVVVYLDNDATVAVHANELLADDANASFAVGDLRESSRILQNPEVNSRIDFTQPVAVLLTAVLHFVPPEDEPYAILDRLKAELASGSYLALSHGTGDNRPPEHIDTTARQYQNASARPYSRTRKEVAHFFDGLEMVPPYPGADAGVTYGGLWGAMDPESADDDASRQLYVGVGYKP